MIKTADKTNLRNAANPHTVYQKVTNLSRTSILTVATRNEFYASPLFALEREVFRTV